MLINDYVVAISLETGQAVKAWPGSVYRSFSAKRIRQYYVTDCSCTAKAVEHAEETHRHTATYGDPVVFEEKARIEKALALSDLLAAANVPLYEVQRFDQEKWDEIAKLVGVKSPSPKTQAKVLEMLQARRTAVIMASKRHIDQFGVGASS
jgi:hypothetical protein